MSAQRTVTGRQRRARMLETHVSENAMIGFSLVCLVGFWLKYHYFTTAINHPRGFRGWWRQQITSFVKGLANICR